MRTHKPPERREKEKEKMNWFAQCMQLHVYFVPFSSLNWKRKSHALEEKAMCVGETHFVVVAEK